MNVSTLLIPYKLLLNSKNKLLRSAEKHSINISSLKTIKTICKAKPVTWRIIPWFILSINTKSGWLWREFGQGWKVFTLITVKDKYKELYNWSNGSFRQRKNKWNVIKKVCVENIQRKRAAFMSEYLISLCHCLFFI